MTHDPLTSSQIALLNECDKSPIEMKVIDQSSSQRGKDVTFLMRAGYFAAEQVHLAQDSGNNIFRFKRTNKTYP